MRDSSMCRVLGYAGPCPPSIGRRSPGCHKSEAARVPGILSKVNIPGAIRGTSKSPLALLARWLRSGAQQQAAGKTGYLNLTYEKKTYNTT